MIAWLGALPPLLILVAVGLLSFAEAASFVGLVVPGETALLLAGALASTGAVSLPVLIVVAAVTAVLGDSVGYEIGRRLGPRLRRGRLGRWIGPARWDRAEQMIARRGPAAVFLGRWVGVLRALVPALAGATGMGYRRFLLWNVLGGITWATGIASLGYAAGAALPLVQRILGRVSVVVVVLVVAVVVVHTVRKRRAGIVSATLSEGTGAAGDSGPERDTRLVPLKKEPVMSKRKKIIGTAVVAVVLAVGGGGLAYAAGGGEHDSGTEVAATGPDADRAGKAAVDSVGGGTVAAIHAENEGTVAFDVEVTKTDGTLVEVQVTKDFTVSAPEAAENDGAEGGAPESGGADATEAPAAG